MSMDRNFLEREIVLVLNKNWQAVGVKNPLEAISMMYCDAATGLHIEGDNMSPMSWESWLELPCLENDYVSTVTSKIKIPKVIILAKYNQVPHKRPRLTAKNIWQRDNGTCQYTGKKLTPNEGNIDHVLPRSRGGRTSWSNCVLSHKDVNSLKGDKTPHEAGLRLLKQPREPIAMPTIVYIKNHHNIEEWNTFLIKE